MELGLLNEGPFLQNSKMNIKQKIIVYPELFHNVECPKIYLNLTLIILKNKDCKNDEYPFSRINLYDFMNQ